MVHFSKEKINNLDKIYRLNLINSCTGYKSANLLGSIDSEGKVILVHPSQKSENGLPIA